MQHRQTRFWDLRGGIVPGVCARLLCSRTNDMLNKICRWQLQLSKWTQSVFPTIMDLVDRFWNEGQTLSPRVYEGMVPLKQMVITCFLLNTFPPYMFTFQILTSHICAYPIIFHLHFLHLRVLRLHFLHPHAFRQADKQMERKKRQREREMQKERERDIDGWKDRQTD